MAISLNHEVAHKGARDLIVRGVLEHHHIGELLQDVELATVEGVHLERTMSGGIAYEFLIHVEKKVVEPSAADLDAIAAELEAGENTATD